MISTKVKIKLLELVNHDNLMLEPKEPIQCESALFLVKRGNVMRRGTTPTLTIRLIDMDVKDLGSIYVTFKQGDKKLTKVNGQFSIDEENNAVSVPFTQEDTLYFGKGMIETQIRALLQDGTTAVASKIREFSMERILLDGVIEEVE